MQESVLGLELSQDSSPKRGRNYLPKGSFKQSITEALLPSRFFPIPEIHTRFEELKQRHKSQSLIHLEYNEKLAHQLYAALDFLLVPSQFEPCGLTQMIAMRYGTLPIVHATGGLKDTVFDPEDEKRKANGFVFKEWTTEALHHALGRVFKSWRGEAPLIETLTRHGMAADWGWEKPAQEYLKLFQMQNQALLK